VLNALYRRYETHLLNAAESDAKRLCVVCKIHTNGAGA
jgi:hypothetical protein